MAQNGEKKGVLPQIIVSAVVALLVGGTSPWWWNEFFHKKNESNHFIQESTEGIHTPDSTRMALSDEVAGRIEELERELEKNENDQIRARQEVERIRPFLETDRDALQALENQERWLEELEMNKQNIEKELKRLREHR